MAKLRSRVWLLEQTLQTHGIVLQTANTAPQPPPPVADATLPPAAPIGTVPLQGITVPRFGATATASQKNQGSLESRIGSQWFNRMAFWRF